MAASYQLDFMGKPYDCHGPNVYTAPKDTPIYVHANHWFGVECDHKPGNMLMCHYYKRTSDMPERYTVELGQWCMRNRCSMAIGEYTPEANRLRWLEKRVHELTNAVSSLKECQADVDKLKKHTEELSMTPVERAEKEIKPLKPRFADADQPVNPNDRRPPWVAPTKSAARSCTNPLVLSAYDVSSGGEARVDPRKEDIVKDTGFEQAITFQEVHRQIKNMTHESGWEPITIVSGPVLLENFENSQ